MKLRPFKLFQIICEKIFNEKNPCKTFRFSRNEKQIDWFFTEDEYGEGLVFMTKYHEYDPTS